MHGSAVNPTLDIIDTIVAESSFRLLLSALQAAHMVDLLKGAGPFTLLAPTDDAFANTAVGSLLQWEKPENEAKLTSLLEGHIIKGVHNADDLRQRMSIQPLTGKLYSIATSSSGIVLGGALLLGHGIPCTNGMIHVIDAVLQPA